MGLIDLPATIAELAAVTLPYTTHSRSFVPLLDGGPEDPEAMVSVENGFHVEESHCIEILGDDPNRTRNSRPDAPYYPQSKQMTEHPESMPRTLAARSATEKLFLRPRERGEFYDISSDPAEAHNLFDDPACSERIGRMKARVLDWHIIESDVVPTDHDPRFIQSPRWP